MVTSKKQDKLIIVCGPTATGKTTLALKLAKEFNGEIVSADSRQVYRGMNIGTGKDIDNGQWKIDNEKLGHWEIARIPIWLYDVVKPNQLFSVMDYYKLARDVIEDIRQREKLPIVVGGTGFYIQGLIDGIESLSISRDEKLRENLAKLTVEQLQKKLDKVHPERLQKMNNSDRNNPRRLIRAIEIAVYSKQQKTKNCKLHPANHTSSSLGLGAEGLRPLIIGLTAPPKIIYQRIDSRVEQMIWNGLEKEVVDLVEKHNWSLPSMSGIGYRQWQSYFEGVINKKEVIQKIKLATHAFARRQLTWFKRDPRIHWFDTTRADCYDKIKQAVYEYTKN